MDAIKAILTRRSIRQYKDKKVPLSVIRKLITAGRSAPSGMNSQPWVFVNITKKETKEELIRVKSQLSKFIAKAPLIIACCYEGTGEHNLENVAVAAENILIAAHALGLGACYVTAFDSRFPEIKESIIKALKLPVTVQPVCLITIGYPDEKPKKKLMKPLKCFREFYGSN